MGRPMHLTLPAVAGRGIPRIVTGDVGHRGLRCGHDHPHGGAESLARRHLGLATQPVSDVLDDRQAQPRAAKLA